VTLSIAFIACLATVFFEPPDSERFPFSFVMICLFALAYLLYRANLSWIEISADRDSFTAVPSWFGRKLWDERPTVARIHADSELIVCRRSAYGAVNDYRLIIRLPGEPDQILWSGEGISRRYWEKMAQQIQQQHGLKARLITQSVNEQGVQEASWTAARHKKGREDTIPRKAIVVAVLPMIFPWLGIAARLITPNPYRICEIGAFLWCVAILSFSYLHRFPAFAKKRNLTTSVVVWTLTFVPTFAVTALLTGIVVNRGF
jgi:hypothetical protein